MHLNVKMEDFKAYITVFLSRFDTFLQSNVHVLKTIIAQSSKHNITLNKQFNFTAK